MELAVSQHIALKRLFQMVDFAFTVGQLFQQDAVQCFLFSQTRKRRLSTVWQILKFLRG